VSPASAIDPELIEEYRLTRYHVEDGPHQFVLEVDRPSAELRRLYGEFGAECAAFLTAWNPFSKPTSKVQNQRANQALLAELELAGYVCLDGFGKGRDPRWEPEASLLVLNITREQAREVATRYGQNAILWADADAIPQLILLR